MCKKTNKYTHMRAPIVKRAMHFYHKQIVIGHTQPICRKWALYWMTPMRAWAMHNCARTVTKTMTQRCQQRQQQNTIRVKKKKRNKNHSNFIIGLFCSVCSGKTHAITWYTWYTCTIVVAFVSLCKFVTKRRTGNTTETTCRESGIATER